MFNIKIIVLVLFYAPLQIVAQGIDRFAEIGNKVAAIRTHLLVTPAPPPLPFIRLPFQIGSEEKFSPMNRMDTPEELEEELKKFRTRYASFMQNLTPAIENKRENYTLTKFNWRVETPEDRKNFSIVTQCKGKWQQISIPHYGPPLGKASTYYLTDFELRRSMLEKGAIFISFKAVDYKAHVFVNGVYVGSHEGAFAPFEFDVTSNIKTGINQLLIKVDNDYPMMGHIGEDGKKFDGDKIYAATGLGYNDPELGWHHCPPGMGIWQDVTVEARPTLHINDVFVRPLADSDSAEVWLEVNNTNLSNASVKVRHSVYGQNFQQTVYEKVFFLPTTIHVPGVGDLVKPTDWEKKTLKMGKGVNFLRFRIHIPKARHWDTETPWLYQLQCELLDSNDEVLDVRKQHFGMRSFRMDTVSIPKGAMYLNEKFIRLRGANTMGSFMQNVMRKNWQQLIDDILLAKIANMNYIRMTQFPVQQEVYDYCDMLGLLTQTDLPLFGVVRRNKWAECIRQTEEMERLVRSHPCNIMVSYINERFPNAEGNPQRHFDSYEDFDHFFKAADRAVLLTNPDRVIKAGDGDYDPPSPGLPDSHCYNGWYNGHGIGLGEMYKGYWMPVKPNWYYACGEFGSEGLDPLNTMLELYPKHWLPATISEEKSWTPNMISMAQTYRFHYMWMNRQSSMQNWINESQAHQAMVTKLTTESFRRNNNMVSFAIHLFIDAWPAGWMKSIMDVKRQPKKAYFEYAQALQPLAVSLRSDRFQYFSGDSIQVETWISNDRNECVSGTMLRYQWENGNKVLGSGKVSALIPLNSSKFQGFVTMNAPEVQSRTTLILRLQLVDESENALAETDFKVTVFPKTPFVKKRVWIAGNTKGIALTLANDLGLSILPGANNAEILLIDSLPAYQTQKLVIDSLVKKGKTAVFLRPAAGEFIIENDSVVVVKTTMGQYYFVSPSLENGRMKFFQPNDFRFWYNRTKDVISPVIGEMSQMKGWTGLLKTGQTGWVGSSDYAFAAAEKKSGKGFFRINHMQLVGRIKDNPTAKEFAKVLLGLGN